MAELKQHDDGSLGIFSEQEGISLLRIGGPANPVAQGMTSGSAASVASGFNYRGVFTVKVPLINPGTANITGNMGVWTNPFSEKLIVGLTKLAYIVGQTVTHSITVNTCTPSAGMPSGGTLGNLIDAYNYNTADATPVANNVDNHGTNGKASVIMLPGDQIVVTCNRTLLTAQVIMYVDVQKV